MNGSPRFRRRRFAFAAACLIVLFSICGWSMLRAQSPQQPQQQSQLRQQPAASPAQPSPSPAKAPATTPPGAAQPAAHIDRKDIVNHLNAAISWYRDSNARVQALGQPSDVIYQDTAQNFAAEALRLAFQSATEEAEILATAEKGNATDEENQPDASGQPNYTRFETRLATQMADLQSQIDAQNKIIDTATANTRQQALAKRDTLQGQMDLYKAMQDAVEKMATFAETTEASTSGLAGTISTLARSVPEVLEIPKNASSAKTSAAQTSSTQPRNATPPAPTTQAAAAQAPTGLIGQMVALYDQLTDMHALDGMVAETARVRDAANAVRQPLRDNLVATIRAGNIVMNQNSNPQAPAAPSPQGQAQPSAQSAPSQTAADVQKMYRDLTAKFRSYSDAMVPLAQETAVLDQSQSNFQEWRRSIARESRVTLQSLLTRVFGIALALGAVFLVSELWRRLTFRYIREPRRRRQFLVLRKFVIGFLFGIVVILGFVSEFSSLATFAGFVTAGIAVGLQTVLLSVAAYFFVIGRYGIRVGDRISISGVTGDVIDVGLVRLYMMELAGPAVDLYPTGRIVVFSNSVLFQAATPLYKQLPGTDYTWHEVVLDLAPGGNHKAAETKITSAVNAVFEKYRANLEQQSGYVEGHMEFQLKSPAPESKLQFSDTGLELMVRYPVELRKEAETDDLITRALIDTMNSDPELKNAVSSSPKIRAVVKG
jgi:small-conductance mechanosensitive channel